MIVAPSATAARNPPEWSKCVCVLTTYLIGLFGIAFFTSAMMFVVVISLFGASMRTMWSLNSTATLRYPPVVMKIPSPSFFVVIGGGVGAAPRAPAPAPPRPPAGAGGGGAAAFVFTSVIVRSVHERPARFWTIFVGNFTPPK